MLGFTKCIQFCNFVSIKHVFQTSCHSFSEHFHYQFGNQAVELNRSLRSLSPRCCMGMCHRFPAFSSSPCAFRGHVLALSLSIIPTLYIQLVIYDPHSCSAGYINFLSIHISDIADVENICLYENICDLHLDMASLPQYFLNPQFILHYYQIKTDSCQKWPEAVF